ncbi:MAG TPA: hypothetical protein VGN72_20305 [Tepidisphaeraceae bacterium]|jgi:hypothetical protein|nr:hypothetical protein [Tepidisphaeraceae bacterium]
MNPISSRVQMHNNRPTLYLGDEPQSPFFYALTDVPGGRWSWEELPQHNIARFAAQGVTLFQLDIALDHMWLADGRFSVEMAQKQVRGVLEVCPTAAVFLRLHVRPPKWWMLRHPEENTTYFDSDSLPDLDGGFYRLIEEDAANPSRTSLASQKWRDECQPIVRRFCQEFSQMPEGNALAGVQVAGGVYGEWHYWGFIGHEPDASVPMQRHFRTWLQNKYANSSALQKAWNDPDITLESATVPDKAARQHTSDGVFRDPQLKMRVVDYYRCQHECVADCIILFARTIKESWPRPIVTGAFYGYFFSTFGRDAAGGHLEVGRVLDSPHVDYLSGPAAYYPDVERNGEPYRSRSIIDSCRLHGKLWLDEMDKRTHLPSRFLEDYKQVERETVMNVRRNITYPHTRGTGFWFYDFGPSGMASGIGKNATDHGNRGWWDTLAIQEDIGRVRALLQERYAQSYESDADVLCVFDTESYYYIGSVGSSDPIGVPLVNWMTLGFYRAGVVFDQVRLADLERVDLSRYKVVAFMNTWKMTEQQRRFVRDHVAQHGRHLLWNYAPAYTDGTRNDTSLMRDATQLKLDRIAIEGGAQIVSNAPWNVGLKWGVSAETVTPLFAVTDEAAEAWAHYESTSLTAVARKRFETHTAVYVGLPSYDPNLGKELMRQTPAHRYTDGDDVVYAGGGLLVIVSANGGTRQVTLRGGKTFNLEMGEGVSTRVLDARTGEVLL